MYQPDRTSNIKTVWTIGILVVMILGLLAVQYLVKQNQELRQQASGGQIYYVSLTGQDTNPGTQTEPFRTFVHAVSVLQDGDILQIGGGTYNERLVISKSGTADRLIEVRPIPGQQVVIDLAHNGADNIHVTGSYVLVEGLEVKNADSSGYCVKVNGRQGASHVTLRSLTAHDCSEHGIYTDAPFTTIENSTVYRASTSNQARTATSGWGSGIKVRVGGDNVTIRNNSVYNNYGEGIAITRGLGGLVTENQVWDNFSENIYIDNSRDITVTKNFLYCTANSGFERQGRQANAITLGEEYYDGWGAQLGHIQIVNNIISRCDSGVQRYAADVSGGGLDNVMIAHNTIWDTFDTAISIEYDAAKTRNSTIANNLVYRSGGNGAWIENRTGIDMHHNYWVFSSQYATDLMNSTGPGDIYDQNPLFVGEPNSSDPSVFALQSGSPAVNAGQAVAGVTTDFIDTVRDATPDMGAFEFGEVAPSPPASPSPSPLVSPSPSPEVSPSPSPETSPSPIPTPSYQGYYLDTISESEVSVILLPDTGYGVNALLRDDQGNVVTDQTDFNFVWTSSNTEVITVSSWSPADNSSNGTMSCIYGVNHPCPAFHADLTGVSHGTATITTQAYSLQTGSLVAQASFVVTVIASASPTPTPEVSPTPSPTPEASPSPSPETSPSPIPTASPSPSPSPSAFDVTDIDRDGDTDLFDFSHLKNELANHIGTYDVDLNQDGMLNLLDFSTWKNEYSRL